MSTTSVSEPRSREGASLRARVWFAFMLAMWLLFFALVFASRLDGLWAAIRDLPLIAQIILWVPFLPWMLGMAVWTSGLAAWLRVLLVACFAIGWTIAFIPRAKKPKRARAGAPS